MIPRRAQSIFKHEFVDGRREGRRTVVVFREAAWPKGQGFQCDADQRDFPLGILGFQPASVGQNTDMRYGGVQNNRVLPQIDNLGRP